LNVKRSVSQLGYSIIESDLLYIPRNRIQIESEEDLALVSKLYSKLEEEPDVVKIHDNIE
jgi:transcriptional/translational regulatory protein YebC/TACO1